jgi:beta-lactamase regulating signal transducer with metallopeptidase domain
VLPWWRSRRLFEALLGLWIAGTAAMVLLQGVRIMRFRRLVFLGQAAPRWLVRQVRDRAALLRIRRPVTSVVPRIHSPFVWSFGRPRLLWPASLLDCLPQRSSRSIIVHELAHLRRRDHWVGWFLMLADCLWWWNPLFWYIRRQLRLNAELACDAWVISTLPEDRRAYAEALIEVTQLVSATAAPVPALGMSTSARQVFERRLTMIMRDQVPCKVPLVGLLVIGLLGLVALPGWSQGPAKKAEPKKPETKKTEEQRVYHLDVMDNPTAVLALDKDLLQNYTVIYNELLDEKAGQPTTEAERDKRLQAVEKQLQALLKEVQALRAGKQAIELKGTVRSVQEVPLRLHVSRAEQPHIVARVVQPLNQELQRLRVEIAVPGDQVLNLSRASYKLPHAKAEVLGAFLRDHVKAKVIETKVEGDTLIVTTTPDVQKAIGGLVGLMQGHATAGLESNRPLNLKAEAQVELQNAVNLIHQAKEAEVQVELQNAVELHRAKEAEKPKPKK